MNIPLPENAPSESSTTFASFVWNVGFLYNKNCIYQIHSREMQQQKVKFSLLHSTKYILVDFHLSSILHSTISFYVLFGSLYELNVDKNGGKIGRGVFFSDLFSMFSKMCLRNHCQLFGLSPQRIFEILPPFLSTLDS